MFILTLAFYAIYNTRFSWTFFDVQHFWIKPEHLEQLARLPFYHKDPFDRLIIAQAIAENISIITKDSMFKNYPIGLFW
ncbi:MAG: type II toxin-antitoxin system VapC family toxin [Snowella sp.]|nr:type II toxin-antitoxin system VapC family toxin [Snowella sp.]